MSEVQGRTEVEGFIKSLLCPLQYFESDDPDLYTTKVQYIQENDVTDLGLTFAEEEFDSNGGAPTVSSTIKIQ